MSSSINPPSRNRSINVGKGGELVIIDNDVDEVLGINMEKNARLRDFVEGNWDNYDFKSFNEGFTAFYEELHRIGFTEDQKDQIFSKARIIGWDTRSQADKRLLFKEARRQIKEKKGEEKKKAKEKKEEVEEVLFTPTIQHEGTLYEEIYTNGTALFIDSEGATYESIDIDGITHAPINADELTEGAVLLPSGLEPYEDEKTLINEIKAHIHHYVDVSDFFETIAAYYILLTWLYDELNTLPYLRALGDSGCGKSRFLDVVGRLCYKATMVSGAVTPAPIYRLIRKWHGTIVIDEGDFKVSDEQNEVVKILNCGFERGRPVVRSQKDNPDSLQILPTFSPKIISSRKRFKDIALESRCLTEVMRETSRDDVPYLLPKRFYEAEERVRNKLLAFRFRNHGKVDVEKAQELDGIDIENRLKQAVSSFIVLFANNKEVFDEFEKFLLAYNNELIEERADTFEGMIVQAIFDVISEVPSGTLSLCNGTDGTDGTFAIKAFNELVITPKDISELLTGKYGYKEANPKWVGKILRTLGIGTQQQKIAGEKKRVLLLEANHLLKLKKKYIPNSFGESTVGTKSTMYRGENETWYPEVTEKCLWSVRKSKPGGVFVLLFCLSKKRMEDYRIIVMEKVVKEVIFTPR
jgi:hypothetical protein